MSDDDVNIRELTPNRHENVGLVAASSTCRRCCACSESAIIGDSNRENERHISHGFTILVSDQNRALEFYTKSLDFELVLDKQVGEDRWIQVAPKQSTAAITLIEPSPRNMSNEEFENAKKSIGMQTGIWFNVNDIQSTYKEFRSRGITITQPEKQDWGDVMSIVEDLDGNKLGFISKQA